MEEGTQKSGGWIDTFGSKENITLILVMLLGAFVAILNETLLNVALPKIMADMNVNESTVQWLTTGYLLVIGVLVPVTAFLIQRFTTRTLFMSAMGLFTAGTLLAGIAPGFGTLLIGRILQAAGTALIFPLLMNVVLAIIPVHKRGSAMGTIGIIITFAPALGPTISGLVIEHFSWRVLFYGVIPIALIVMAIAYAKLKNVTETESLKIDLFSMVLSTLGFGGIVYGFSAAGGGHGEAGELQAGWMSGDVIVPIVVGLLALIVFTWRQLTMDEPMLDLRSFQYRMFRYSVVILMIAMVALFSTMLLLPIFLQNALHYSPLEAGLAMLPGGIIMGIMSPITGRLFDAFGPKWLAVVGMGLLTVTLAGFAFITTNTPYATLLILNALFMLGLSMTMMPVMTNGLNQLPRRLYPHGTAIMNTLQQVGGAIGTALLVTLMTLSSSKYMERTGNALSDTAAQMDALLYGMKTAFLTALALVLAAFVASFFLQRTVPQEDSLPAGAAAAGEQ